MLKFFAVAVFWGLCAPKLVGTEFVSPQLQVKARRQQEETPEHQISETAGNSAAPLDAQTDIQLDADESLSPEHLKESQNAFGATDSALSGSSGEVLSEDEITEIQMLLALRDVVRLEDYLRKTVEQINQRIYGDLENSLLINKFTQSFQMYDMILGVLQKYQLNKASLNAKANYLKRTIGHALEYIKSTDERFMQMIDDDDSPEERQRNREVFLEVLANLDEEVEKFAAAITKDMAESFDGIEQTHQNPVMSDLQKIHTLVESALNLVVFKKSTLQTCATNVLEMRKLVLDNPKYHNHLKKIQNDRIVLGSASRRGGAWWAALLAVGLAVWGRL